MKNVIFFRIDRLGDYLIITNIIRAIKNKYPYSKITVVASKFNYKFIKKFKIVDRVILFNKNYDFFKKFSIFNQINDRNYDVSFSVDGKSFSNLCIFFLRSKLKLGLIYKLKFFGLSYYKPNFLFKFILDHYETFTSKNCLLKPEHLPTKLINLANRLSLNIKIRDNYYFSPSNIKYFKNKYEKYTKKKYILIHLDEKWKDIKNIEHDLYYEVVKFQKKSKYNLVITSYKNNSLYYKNFKYFLRKSSNKKIFLLENTNLDIMERLIKYSFFSISCHSGFLVHIAGANNSDIIDIINKYDLKWYSCWIPKNTFHKFIFKSSDKKRYILNDIFLNIIKIINIKKRL